QCEAGAIGDGARSECGAVARVRQNHRHGEGARTSGGEDEREMNEPYDLIQNASLTEKATLLSEKHNKYVFRVNPRANKIQIKKAIEHLFHKKVIDVNTCNYAGKKKRERRADYGRK